MNDQWKQLVADAYDAFGDCAPATPVRRLLRLIDAQDRVVRALHEYRSAEDDAPGTPYGIDETPRLECARAELDAAIRALAELKLE